MYVCMNVCIVYTHTHITSHGTGTVVVAGKCGRSADSTIWWQRTHGVRIAAIEAPTLRWSLKVLAAALAAVADGESYLPAAALGLWKPNDGLRHVSQRTLSVLEVLIHKINPKRRPDLRQMPC